MRSQLQLWISCCALFLCVAFASGCHICEEGDCVHGECKSGRCKCEEGWQGGDCNTREKNALTGDYSVTSSRCGNYTVTIIVSENANYDLQIIGLHGLPDTLGANKDKDLAGDWAIPKQPCSPAGYQIDGTAIKNGNGTTTLNYATWDLDNIPDDICIATFTKL
jgi:hypothetical protein